MADFLTVMSKNCTVISPQSLLKCTNIQLLCLLSWQGLCFAPLSSEQLSLCYANRSAALYHLQLYQVSWLHFQQSHNEVLLYLRYHYKKKKTCFNQFCILDSVIMSSTLHCMEIISCCSVHTKSRWFVRAKKKVDVRMISQDLLT